MADSIRLSLTPDRLETMPDGDPIEAVITIQNVGTSVDQYAVELDGLPTTWYSLSSAAVALFPQDKDEAKLVIHPPKANGVKAGTYPFTVTVLSRSDTTQTTRTEGTLQVGAIAVFELDMSPKKVIGRRGRYTLTMRNGGNSDVDVDLAATDSEDGCTFKFKPEEVHLGSGQRGTVQLQARAQRSGLVGSKKQYDLQVKATPSRGEAKTVSGQFVHTPRFRTWKPIRRIGLLVLVLIVVLVAVLSWNGPNGLGAKADQARSSVSKFTCQKMNVFCSAAATAIPSPLHTHPVKPLLFNTYAFHPFAIFHTADHQLIGRPLRQANIIAGGFAEQPTTNGTLIYDPQSHHSFFIARGGHVYEFDEGGAGTTGQAITRDVGGIK